MGFGRIECVSNASPNEFSLLRGDYIQISFDAYLLFFFQIVGSVDYRVYRAVVSIEAVVIRIRNHVVTTGGIGDVIFPLDQARHYDGVNLVLADLGPEIIEVKLGTLGPEQDNVARNRLHASSGKLRGQSILEVGANPSFVAQPQGQHPLKLLA